MSATYPPSTGCGCGSGPASPQPPRPDCTPSPSYTPPAPTATVCCDGIPGGLVRTRFFNGMYLTEADFVAEQSYWRQKRRLTNRALGHGVVWGLRVRHTSGRFVLSPGYGLDCCGNDLVVTCQHEVSVRDLVRDYPVPQQSKANLPIGRRAEERFRLQSRSLAAYQACLLLEYVECPEEPRVVHKDPCGTDSRRCESSRVRESVRLRLTPPPEPERGTIGRFLDDLLEVREGLAPEIRERLFPGLNDPVADEETELPFTLVIRGRRRDVALRPRRDPGSGRFALGSSLSDVLFFVRDPADPSGLAAAEIHFELRPDPGYVLYSGEVSMVHAGERTPVVQVEPPFGLHLTWSWRLPERLDPASGDGAGWTDGLVMVIESLGIAPLFGVGRQLIDEMEVVAEVEVQPATDAFDALSSTRAMVAQFKVSAAQPTSPPFVLHRLPCLLELADGGLFFEGHERDQLITPKVLLLALLHGLMTDVLRIREVRGAEDGGDESWNGPGLLAYWLYAAAWRVLFDADVYADGVEHGDRDALTQLVTDLLQRWCDGFVYPGPRCQNGSHGIIIGCATFDRSGRVLAFDPWAGRRHVITGPLLTHWGSQLGLAPLDVMARRLIRAVCCWSQSEPRVRTWAMPEGTWAGVVSSSTGEGAGNGFREMLAGGHATTLSDGAYLMYGRPEHSADRLRRYGVRVRAPEYLGLAAFVKKVVCALGNQDPPPTNARYVHYVLDREPGVRLQLVVAEEGGWARRPPRHDGQVLKPIPGYFEVLDPMPPLAHPVAEELATEVTAIIALPTLVVPDDQSGPVAVLYQTLPEYEVNSVAGLIEQPPEPLEAALWERRGEQTLSRAEHRTAFTAIYTAADAVTRAVVGVVHRLAGRSFDRSTLTDGTRVKKLHKDLKRALIPELTRSVPSLTELKAAAERVGDAPARALANA